MDLFLYQLEEYTYQTRTITGRIYDKVTLEVSRSNIVITTIDGYHIEGSSWGFSGLFEIVKSYILENNLAPYVDNFSFMITYYYHTRTNATVSSGEDTESYGIWFTAGQLVMPSSFTISNFAAKRHLTLRRFAWLLPNEEYKLYYWADGVYTGEITFTDEDGEESTEEFTAPDDGLNSVTIEGSSNFVKAVVDNADRPFTLYYVDVPKVVHFEFRNFFGLMERLSLPAAIKKTPETEFETAKQDGVTVRYDVEQKLTMEISTASLPDFVAEAVTEMCRSGKVRMLDHVAATNTDVWRDVHITEYNAEKSDNPNTPFSFSMSIEYADEREVTKGQLY